MLTLDKFLILKVHLHFSCMYNVLLYSVLSTYDERNSESVILKKKKKSIFLGIPNTWKDHTLIYSNSMVFCKHKVKLRKKYNYIPTSQINNIFHNSNSNSISVWFGWFQKKEIGFFSFQTANTLQKKEVYAWWNDPVKRFKNHILYIRKPKVVISVFHYMRIYFFP